MTEIAVIGILALQGDFEAHRRMLDGLGVEARLVRLADELEGRASTSNR